MHCGKMSHGGPVCGGCTAGATTRRIFSNALCIYAPSPRVLHPAGTHHPPFFCPMKSTILSPICTLAALLAFTGAASAHIGYTNRNFGTFAGGEAPVTISNMTVGGNYGWADGTDADYGDSHRLRAYRFTLTYDATVSITATATTNNGLLLGDLLPAYSLYSGLAHLPPAAADHDGATVSVAWLSSLGGVTKEGAFVALGDWKIGSDEGTTFADLSSFTYRGHAADGTDANFGTTPGINGDGLADGTVTGSFFLPAGDYSLFVGGALYAGQGSGTANRGVNVTLSVVPEPSAAAVLLGAALLTAGRRKR